MALQSTDLFYVQRGTDGHKIEYSSLQSEIADSVDTDGFVLKEGDQLTGSLGVAEQEIVNRSDFDLSETHFFRWSNDSFVVNFGSVPGPQNGRSSMTGLIYIDSSEGTPYLPLAWDNSIENPPTDLTEGTDYIIPFYIKRGGITMVLGSPVEVS
jgi:hypothetical protein